MYNSPMLNINFIESKRKRLKMNKGEFSQHLGIKQSNYSMLLKHKTTSLATIDQIARALSIKATRLINE